MKECPGGLSAGDCGMNDDDDAVLACMEWTGAEMEGLNFEYPGPPELDQIPEADWEDVSTDEDEQTEATRTRSVTN